MSDLLDEELLAELREIMEDEFPDLLETFLAESERQYAEIRGAWQAQDLEQLSRAAHSLKGSCGNVGATQLHSLCAELEQQARAGESAELAGLEALVSKTEQDLADVCVAISAL